MSLLELLIAAKKLNLHANSRPKSHNKSEILRLSIFAYMVKMIFTNVCIFVKHDVMTRFKKIITKQIEEVEKSNLLCLN